MDLGRSFIPHWPARMPALSGTSTLLAATLVWSEQMRKLLSVAPAEPACTKSRNTSPIPSSTCPRLHQTGCGINQAQAVRLQIPKFQRASWPPASGRLWMASSSTATRSCSQAKPTVAGEGDRFQTEGQTQDVSVNKLHPVLVHQLILSTNLDAISQSGPR